MDKLKSNLNIYDNLLESESEKLILNDKDLNELQKDILGKIKKYIDKNI